VHLVLSSGSAVPGILWAVVGVTLAAGVACVGVGVWFAVEDRRMAEPLRQAVRIAGRRAQEHYQVVLPLPPGPVGTTPPGVPGTATPERPGPAPGPTATEQRLVAPGVDFSGIAQLAEALGKLKPSGQFVVAGIVFLTIAMATAVAGLAAL
jgi:hypothetical protein